MRFVSDAFEDADVFLYLVEPGDRALKDQGFFEKLLNTKVPLLLIINKIDTTDQEKLEAEVGYWGEELPNAEIVPISALQEANTDYLLERLISLMPESPPYFEKDALTDKTERFFVSEIIREQILLNYKKEIPYSVEVDVEEFKEEEYHPHAGNYLRGSGLTKGHHHWTQRHHAQTCGCRSRKQLEKVLRKEGAFRNLCEGEKELA